MKRLGLIGVGAWGKRYIATVAKQRDCQLVAVARASSSSEREVAGIRLYPNWRELLELGGKRELDGLIVATTPDHQAQVVAAAIDVGLPVLAEKPLGLSRRVPEELLARWQRAQAKPPVLVNFVHLWAPAYRTLAERVRAEGGARAVQSIVSAGCATGPFRGWSSLYDYGPHDAALLVRLLGVGLPLSIRAAKRIETAVGPGAELFELEFSLGHVRVTATLGNGSPDKRRFFAVRLESGRTLVYDDTRPHADKLMVDGSAVALEPTMPLDAVVADFLERVGRWREAATSVPGASSTMDEPDPAGRNVVAGDSTCEAEQSGIGLELSCEVARILDVLSEHVPADTRANPP